MAGRFPGAPDVATLWHHLRHGEGGLRELTEADLDAAGVDPALRADPRYVRVGGPVDGVELFDATAFGCTDREAETMEPQHRLLLECAWEALEHAGYCPTDPGVPVGVFAGCAYPDYLTANVPDLADQPGGRQYLAAGVERDSLTSLISYKLGLQGPSLTVQTYCSTSLVAVHLACQSLLTYECDMALAGGAALPLPQTAGYRPEEGGILSPDGRVRSLDAAANGTVMGSGVALVALKRLADALADGDVVHAVILGSAVNNDGRDRAGYAAPGAAGQAAVIETGLAVAGVKPESVGYVECHAVGTPLGDSIELAALSRVFTGPRPTPCVLSSVKPQLGHLDRAAGVTGLLRAALSLRHRVLPGTAGHTAPNPALAGLADRFTVLTEDRSWPAGPEPRRAAVSSFGVGGTNAHVVLEEPPARPARDARPGPHLLLLSAADRTALDEATGRLRAHLAEHPDQELADVAFTLQVSRGRFALRRVVVCADRADALAALADPARWLDGETRRRDPRIRLVPGDAVPDAWWRELAAAARRLLDPDAPAPAADRAAALDTLTAGLRRIGVRLDDPADDAPRLAVAPDDGPADRWVLTAVARLWLAGAAIDWARLHPAGGRRVELPTYPFQRRRHWIEARTTEPATVAPAAPGRVPVWRQSPESLVDLDRRLRAAGPWLVLTADPRGEALVDRLWQAGAEVVAVRPGDSFAVEPGGDLVVRPDHPDDLAAALRALVATPRTVLHALALGPSGDGAAASATALAAALGAATGLPPVELVLLTDGAVEVTGGDLRHPGQAALAALAGRLAADDRHRDCRHLDLTGDVDPDRVLAGTVRRHDGPLAIRAGRSWLGGHEPAPWPETEPELPAVLPTGTVLVTGGLTGTGLAVAGHFAERYRCRLVLTAAAPAAVPEELLPSGAPVRVVTAAPGDDAALRRALDALDTAPDVVVHTVAAGDPDTAVADLRALAVALGGRVGRRVLLCPADDAGTGTVLAAHAAADGGPWTVVETPLAGEAAAELVGLVLAAGHTGHVLLTEAPPRRATTDGGDPAGTPDRSGPARPRPALATAFLEPAPGVERAVAAAWAAALGLAEIGADDNFFELGGRSAAAVQIAGRLAEEVCPGLALTAVVEHPTVRLLAAEITTRTGG
jgi:3-oxoacyl-(acyl-carrier-protein) synthase